MIELGDTREFHQDGSGIFDLGRPVVEQRLVLDLLMLKHFGTFLWLGDCRNILNYFGILGEGPTLGKNDLINLNKK